MRNVVRLDDLSPVIRYQPGAWHTGVASDEQATLYSDGGTFTVTNVNHASLSISWNGTGIAIYGAKRPNHGNYTVSLDGAEPETHQGFRKPGQFGQPLFRASNLTSGPHSVALSDASSDYLDIDWIDVETVVGETATRLEDTDAAFRFLPSEGTWSTSSSLIKNFSGNSGHVATTPDASVEITFTGNAIDVFGLVCPNCGAYSVQLDGVTEDGVFNASSSTWRKPQTILYFARNLAQGEHRIVLTSKDDNALAVDYAVVHSRGAGSAADDTQPTSQPTDRRISPYIIVGSVLGGVLFCLLVVLGVIFCVRRRRRNRDISSYTAHPLHLDSPNYTDKSDGGTTPSPPPYEASSSRPSRHHNPAADNPLKQSSELY